MSTPITPITGTRGYSLLRSKTFWTTAAMLAMNVGDALVHPKTGQTLLGPDALAAANLGLTVLAMVFHQMTGNSTSGSN